MTESQNQQATGQFSPEPRFSHSFIRFWLGHTTQGPFEEGSSPIPGTTRPPFPPLWTQVG